MSKRKIGIISLLLMAVLLLSSLSVLASTYTITWGSGGQSQARIHYGYMQNGSFVEFDQSVFSHGVPSIARSDVPNYLIYDVSGYEFDYAYLNSNATDNRIQPLLSFSNGVYKYYNATGTVNTPSTGNVRNGYQIYMVYKPLEVPSNGGTPKIYESSDTPAAPEILKESVNNHDGTRTITLSITGHEAPVELESLADVIVVFDVSGSMDYDIEGDYYDSRLESAKDGLQYLSNRLLDPVMINREGEKLNRMALVTFSNTAQVVQEFTDDPDVFNESIDSLSAGGGTNWEYALQKANRLSVDPDRATYVIFITDGAPTWRMTRYEVSDTQLRNQNDIYTSHTFGYYRVYNVFGQGNSDDQGRNYNAALAEAKSIVNKGKQFYAIAIGDDQAITAMRRLTNEAGVSAQNTYTVQTESQLVDAILDVEHDILGGYGWSNVQMQDGITAMTNLTAKTPVSGMTSPDFTYAITKNGVTQPWDPVAAGAKAAVYNTESKAVEWNMGEKFQLEDGVTYSVSFKVWPSQEAMDIVTDLNNGLRTYDSLPDDIKAQLQVSDGVYTVKTNTDDACVYVTPNLIAGGTSHFTGNPIQLFFQPVDPLVVQTMPMTVEKVFEDSFGDETGDGIGADRPEDIHLILEARPMGSTDEAAWQSCRVTYKNPLGNTVTSEDIWLGAANNWKISFFVSPGLRDKDGIVLDKGHEYRLTEAGLDYHYELITEYMNPYLQGHSEPVQGMDPLLAGAKEVYVTRVYNGDTDGSESLTARNVVKGGLNLTKHVNGAGADPDAEFTIRGYILDPDGKPYLFDPANDERTDKSQRASSATPLFMIHQNDPLPYHFYDKNGTRTVYKGHFADTSNIEFTIRDGEQIRFPIIPAGCTYRFWEVDGDGMPTGFVLESVEGVARVNQLNPQTGQYEFVDSSDLSLYPVVDAENRISGTIAGNTLFELKFTNRFAKPGSITITKNVTNADGTAQVYGNDTFTIKGYIYNRFGRGYTFDPALDDRTDKSQPIPESEYGSHTWDDHQDDPIAYNITDKDGNYVIYKGHFANTGEIEFELRSGDTLEFLNVPDRHTYQFYEVTAGLNQAGSSFEYVSTAAAAVNLDGGTAVQPTITKNTDGYDVAAGTMSVNEAHSIVITNRSLFAEGDVVLEAMKKMTGRELKAKEFSFVLKDAEGNVLQQKKNAANGKIVFDALAFTSNDKDKFPIIYTIEEVPGDLGGVTYTNAVLTVTLSYTNNGDGTLTITPTYSGLENNTFVNEYKSSGEVVLKGKKDLSGQTIEAGMFTFELYDTVKGQVIQTATNDSEGNFEFKLAYDQTEFETDIYQSGYSEGVQTFYTIREVDEGKPGITYDDSEYNVAVSRRDNQRGQIIVTTSPNDPTYVYTFSNEYKSEGEIILEAKKTLKGRELKAEEFSFELCDADGNPVETVKNDADGKVVFSAIKVDNSIFANGNTTVTRTYTVEEVIPDEKEEGMTYDERTYIATVTLTDNGKGVIEAAIVWTVKGEAADAAEFVNEVEIEETTVPETEPTTETDPETTPPTGDSSRPLLYLFMMAGAFVLMAGTVAAVKRKRS